MIQYLLDTNVAIAIMHGEAPVLSHATDPIADGLVGLSICSVGELYFGAFAGNQPEREQQAVEELLEAVVLVEYDQAAAREYGRLRAKMKGLGRPIPPLDTQIAATAVVHGLIVVSGDRHLRMVPDLPVENWLADDDTTGAQQ